MVDLATSFGAGFLATFIPLYLGIFAPTFLSKLWKDRKGPSFLAAASVGIIFWFFLDVMGDAVRLDVDQGVSATVTLEARETQLALIMLFSIGLVVLVVLERKFSPRSASQNQQLVSESSNTTSVKLNGAPFAVAAISALAIGFHALGEGLIIGASLPSSPSIIEAIGSVYAGVAYVLHKLLEGFVIGVFAVLAMTSSPKKLGLLGIISGVPTLIGFLLGSLSLFPDISQFNPINVAFFFALGGAGAIYIEMKLIPLIVRGKIDFSLMIATLIGFYSMYVAGLFHG